METWVDIPGWEGEYQASDAGRIRSVDRVVTKADGQKAKWRGKVLRANKIKNGYPTVSLSRAGQARTYAYVHRLVARTFLGECPDGQEVCHEDGTRDNNAVANLRYDTRAANANDRRKHGTMNQPRGSACATAKLKGWERFVVLLSKTKSNRALGRLFGVSHQTIARVLRDHRQATVR